MIILVGLIIGNQMIKIEFKEAQSVLDHNTISFVTVKFWLCFKIQELIDITIIFSECGNYVQSVMNDSIKSITVVSPTDL